ncbi:helix-turn-helix domain-containing protein [Micromonospora coxensis]|uniref:Helix-turn-helix domain-containing protein n=1 Tax=Micromonospora coxensis TaxID=356852 RepID=A0A1C5IWZ6_9ACTN|nr:AraC family transcriptional regulator [Micromonospora coxensis]SCG62459.1 Helix-turn-helix domain-containing protein [Micromonospora coxensis]
MRQPRGDHRGILDPARLRRELRFRRHLPAPPLRDLVEHYWLIDWELTAPFTQRVVPHPAVNVVFGQADGGPESAEIAGVGRTLFTVTLTGVGRISGIQFRPGGFRPFLRRAVAELTGRRVPLAEVPEAARAAGLPDHPDAVAGGTPAPAAGSVAPPARCAGTDAERCQALDAFLTAWSPRPDPASAEAMALAAEIRADRSVRRVDDFARRHGVPVRRLQRLFLEHVGVGPKWVIRRYRLQEAIELAATGPPDWSALAADLGYSDQSHLIREFTTVTGVSPAAYARSLH